MEKYVLTIEYKEKTNPIPQKIESTIIVNSDGAFQGLVDSTDCYQNDLVYGLMSNEGIYVFHLSKDYTNEMRIYESPKYGFGFDGQVINCSTQANIGSCRILAEKVYDFGNKATTTIANAFENLDGKNKKIYLATRYENGMDDFDVQAYLGYQKVKTQRKIG